MKRDQNRVRKNDSRHRAATQTKNQPARTGNRPASASHAIALFPMGDGSFDDIGASEEIVDLSKTEYAALKRAAASTRDGVVMFMVRAGLEKARWPGGTRHQPTANSGSPSCLCFFDAGVGELAGQIPLVGKELPSVVVAAYRQRTTVDQFIADAIKEKLSKPVDKSPSSSPALEEGFCMPGGIVLKIADCHGNAVGVTKVDDLDAERLQKAATASGLPLEDLLSFIILRQLEAFFPPGVEGLYRVSDNVVTEVSEGLSDAERNSDGLWALCCKLVEQVYAIDRHVHPADRPAAMSKLEAFCKVIKDMSGSVRVNVSDAHTHWRIGARPALLEQHVAPISRPLARAAQPNDQRRAA